MNALLRKKINPTPWLIGLSLIIVSIIGYWMISPRIERNTLKTHYLKPVAQQVNDYRTKEGRLPSIEEFRRITADLPKYRNGKYLFYSEKSTPPLPLRKPKTDFVISAVWSIGYEVYYQPWDDRIYSMDEFD